MTEQKNIRNFAIVAHIDHGKSTLADRLLEETATIEKRRMTARVLDSNPIEKERGITIKLAPVRMHYLHKNQPYILNLIDTPGHVDFSYEVSRSLSACEGILLVVDATQGIQAQTVAHMQLIRSKNLTVIPLINKIDLPTAKIEETKDALSKAFGFPKNEMIEISAKSGLHIEKVLESIILRIPAPGGNPQGPPKALVFSSVYDTHRGVVVYVRVADGSFTNTKNFTFYASQTSFTPVEMGVFRPQMETTPQLWAGEVGFIATGLKDLSLARIGDTLGETGSRIEPRPGYKEPKPMVYLSFFPVDNNDFGHLRESLEKLHLSDSSFTYTVHASAALGKGYLCGFLGLLHAEIVQERLEREFGLSVITSSPTVEYILHVTGGKRKVIHTPEDFPDPFLITRIEEPVMYTTIYAPSAIVGAVMQLTSEKRAEFINLEYIGAQAKFTYIIPLSEMIIDFFDRLKSITSGYASLDYEFFEYRTVDSVKLDVLINKKQVDAFSQIVVREKMQTVANSVVEKLKTLIPRHQFQIPIQAAIGGKIIARADISGLGKDVTAKLYGGDRTRKDKLLEAQKKGKKRMRQFGKVTIPQEAFLSVYKSER